jgi:uncharacterized membrane protein
MKKHLNKIVWFLMIAFIVIGFILFSASFLVSSYPLFCVGLLFGGLAPWLFMAVIVSLD